MPKWVPVSPQICGLCCSSISKYSRLPNPVLWLATVSSRYYFTKGSTRNLDKSLIPLNGSSFEDYKYHKISCRKLIITEIIAFSNIKISVFFFFSLFQTMFTLATGS